ncbi:HdeD family acid-resistance protein [Labrys monachus]|uniref:Uncharacterized membrane protein HdeD (DUF308 family) n=1 Tax=Labrys monachus TaxID=217067 RepID=A0ABU0F6J2_9HYPH|nr:HdeD family acid-resistance protein [Labrys monachus]MDQ0390233.1 uncharacterized membrane protein HdeD (DUF308 family) [Labrys monachus]
METLQQSWRWFLVIGLISVVGGLFALIHPGIASLAVVYWVGWLFLVLGAVQLIQAMTVKAWGGFFEAAVLGVLALLLGVSILLDPISGAISLTALIGVLFLIYGIVKVMIAFRIRRSVSWIWMLLSGLVSILLAVMIFTNFPWSALSLLGILLGVELLANGLALIFTGLALRSA